jgi:hypothetical protein
MELDAARAAVEAARRLLPRALGQVEADERHEQALRRGGGLQRAVVGGAEGRLAVGLVHAEGERADGARSAEEGEQILQGGDETVDVPADVDVRVEELGAGRDQPGNLLHVGPDQSPCALESVFHAGESTLSR